MATAEGLARVAQINATIAKQGQAAPNPTGGGNAVTLKNQSSANPADRYSATAVAAEPTPGELAGQTLTPQNTPNSIPAQGANMAQPSPFTANKATTQASPEQVKAVADATTAVNDLATRYKQGLATANASGVKAPTTQGIASIGVQGSLPGQQTESPSIIGQIQDTDANFDKLFTNFDQLFSPEVQRKSLVEEYQQMSKSLGIEGLNTEILNTKRIIEGTADDIRSEIAAVGGTGTESQVLALSNARNKSLMKNYQALLDTRDSAQTQLTTLMQLSTQDRQMAEAEFDRKLNFAFKVQEFKQKAVDNARENYNSIVKTVGYKGLLAATNGNAYEQSLIEKTLGLGAQGLVKLAGIEPPQKVDTQVVTYGSGSALVNSQTGEIIKTYAGKPEAGTGGDIFSPQTNEQETKRQEVLGIATELLSSDTTGKGSAVGSSFAKLVPFGQSLGLQPGRASFEAKVDSLKSNLALGNLKLLKGAMSDKDLAFLQSVGTSLNTGMSEKEFDAELTKIIKKLGGTSPAPDGSGDSIIFTN